MYVPVSTFRNLRMTVHTGTSTYWYRQSTTGTDNLNIWNHDPRPNHDPRTGTDNLNIWNHDPRPYSCISKLGTTYSTYEKHTRLRWLRLLMIYLWFTYGRVWHSFTKVTYDLLMIYLFYLWFTYDLLMICLWFTYDLLMIQLSYLFYL